MIDKIIRGYRMHRSVGVSIPMSAYFGLRYWKQVVDISYMYWDY